jgi:hypothetical protein
MASVSCRSYYPKTATGFKTPCYSKGKDRIDINTADFADVKKRFEQQKFPVPDNGIVTKEAFQEHYTRRFEPKTPQGTVPANPSSATYYFKRLVR